MLSSENRIISNHEKAFTRLLLIEDDEVDALLFKRSLSDCAGDYELQICSSLSEAITWLIENTCDLILLDLSLPDSFGLVSIQTIRNHCTDIPIVMMTGLDDNKMALDALDSGAQDYLVKGDATSRELERTLRHAIQRQQILNENARLVDQLKHAAMSDALTGLLNRHAMITEFERHWSGSRSTDNPLSCVIFDVDHFKKVNDQFGHVAGDAVLTSVAKLISSNARPGDCIARYGGEEFCVLLVDADEEIALKWADRARHQLAQNPMRLADEEITVTASFGAAQRTAEMKTIEQLIDAADQALLVAKSSGRNRVSGYSTLGTSVSHVDTSAILSIDMEFPSIER